MCDLFLRWETKLFKNLSSLYQLQICEFHYVVITSYWGGWISTACVYKICTDIVHGIAMWYSRNSTLFSAADCDLSVTYLIHRFRTVCLVLSYALTSRCCREIAPAWCLHFWLYLLFSLESPVEIWNLFFMGVLPKKATSDKRLSKEIFTYTRLEQWKHTVDIIHDRNN